MVLTGFETYVFTYGTVQQNDGDALVSTTCSLCAEPRRVERTGRRRRALSCDGLAGGARSAAYPDVAAAHVNPLLHYLQFGMHEGRSPFADGVWG